MAEEIDDNEFFQQDFTTASEWEIFNARLDEIFHDWKLPYTIPGKAMKKNELFLTPWEIKSEIIFFANVELRVSRYRAKLSSNENDNEVVAEDPVTKAKICQSHIDLTNFTNNFCIFDNNKPEKIHPLAVWYGLRDFVVIEPLTGAIINESQFRVLLSSACITVAETNTEIPVFVRVMQKDLNVFLGVCESTSARVNFDIVALENTPLTCRYLSGLLSIFKGKISTTYVQPVMVSVRLTYNLKDFVNTGFCIKSKIPFATDSDDDIDLDDPTNFEPEGDKFFALPYGVSIEHINELILNCTWPEIAENVIVDSSTYSDLDPMLAPVWSIRVNFKQQPIYYLTDSLSDFLKLGDNSRTLSSILGSSYDVGMEQNLEGDNPLDRLTESKIPNIKSVLPEGIKNIKKNGEKKKLDGPIKYDELMQMLYYMFPDAHPDPEFPYEIQDQDNYDPLRIKSTCPDSLVFRLSCLLTTCYSYFGGLSGLAQLWAEFTKEMRYRVERCIQIPGTASGFPDSRTCLLHQKLQMLNICMERRRLREGGLPFSMIETKGTKKRKSEDSDDEFYDCDTDEEQENLHAPWNKPEGRLEKLENLTLIDSPESLYIPVTQDPVPKTEDQLEDDAEVMLKLGPGSELCTQMMSASLLSDMESFKAANPNGKLEDFIRWYSPRDWIIESDENGEEKGRLSQRMLIPGNTWQIVWGQAKPVSAKRQRRLFDDTKEAEKVLHFFETRTVGQICELTISSLFHAAILKIKDELISTNFFECFQDEFDKIQANLCKLSRETWLLKVDPPAHLITSPKKWELLLNDIINLENLQLQTRSLAKKIFTINIKNLDNNQKSIILTLLKGYEAELSMGAKNYISVQILNLFSDARQQKNEFNMEKDVPSQLYLPEPVRKEYILRVEGKTTNKGVGGPQFLRAILDKNMRLCGAFSENTTFV